MELEGQAFLRATGITLQGRDTSPFGFVIPSLRDHEIRHEYIQKFGFAIPTQEAIEVIKKYSPILEVGAGSGYWAFELQKAGADVIATDPRTGKYAFNTNWNPFTEVKKLTAREAISRYPGRTLLTIWPDYANKWSHRALAKYRGDTLIYIGEGPGGCTATDCFFEMLYDDWELVEAVRIPQFHFIHDQLEIYKRKPAVKRVLRDLVPNKKAAYKT